MSPSSDTARVQQLLQTVSDQRDVIRLLTDALRQAVRELEWFAPSRSPMPFARRALAVGALALKGEPTAGAVIDATTDAAAEAAIPFPGAIPQEVS